MLRPSDTHEEYQSFLKESLREHLIDTGQISTLYTQSELIAKMWVTDLTAVAALVAPCYSSSSRGAPPRDPVCLFRSLLVMPLAGYRSIDKWVAALKSFPLFINGFSPDDTRRRYFL